MKYCLLCICLFLFRDVIAQSYYSLSKAPEDSSYFEKTQLDDTYTLYVKRICKKKKEKENIYIPCNCEELEDYTPDDVIENEYMFISRQYQRIVVINYIKDRNQKFYTSSQASKKADKFTDERVDVNISFFNQLRFGRFDNTTLTAHFKVNSSSADEHIWDMEEKDGNMVVKAVRIVQPDGFEHKTTEASLVLVPTFYKAKDFRIIFQNKKKKGGAIFPLPGNSIAVDPVSRNTYFFFDTAVISRSKVLKFKSNRLYAYYKQVWGCKDCEASYLCSETIFSRLDKDKREVVRANWTEFAGQDLEADLPARTGLRVMSLRFDALGCLYPPFVNNRELEKAFVDNQYWTTNSFRTKSFYHLLSGYKDKMQFDNAGRAAVLTGMVDQTKHEKLAYQQFFDFRQAWSRYYLDDFAKKVKDTIASYGIKRCVFFIHGYNVPYSLAQLQGNDVFADFARALPAGQREEDILFIRVFWPSNNAKTLEILENGCAVSDIKNLKVAKQYNYITNRAYMASLSLREFINTLDPDMPVHLISHSMGATIATGVLLHPEKKMGDMEQGVNRCFKTAFDTIPALRQRTFVFLSAPGIPGQSTFCVLDSAVHSRYYFDIGYNNNDKVLRKHVVPVIGFLIPASRGNATTLGSNWRNEAFKVKDIFTRQGLEGHVRLCPNGDKKVHDYFCYRIQPSFIENYAKYVTASVTASH